MTKFISFFSYWLRSASTRAYLLIFILLGLVLIPIFGYLIETRTAQCKTKNTPFQVSGFSMIPVLHDGQSLHIEDITPECAKLTRGDIVVFKQPQSEHGQLVKRLAGMPGDYINRNQLNQLIINEIPAVNVERKFYFIQNEQWLSIAKMLTSEMKIPENKYLFLGENTLITLDSRAFGLVDRSSIIGRNVNTSLLGVEVTEENTFSQYIDKKSYQIMSKLLALFSSIIDNEKPNDDAIDPVPAN